MSEWVPNGRDPREEGDNGLFARGGSDASALLDHVRDETLGQAWDAITGLLGGDPGQYNRDSWRDALDAEEAQFLGDVANEMAKDLQDTYGEYMDLAAQELQDVTDSLSQQGQRMTDDLRDQINSLTPLDEFDADFLEALKSEARPEQNLDQMARDLLNSPYGESLDPDLVNPVPKGSLYDGAASSLEAADRAAERIVRQEAEAATYNWVKDRGQPKEGWGKKLGRGLAEIPFLDVVLPIIWPEQVEPGYFDDMWNEEGTFDNNEPIDLGDCKRWPNAPHCKSGLSNAIDIFDFSPIDIEVFDDGCQKIWSVNVGLSLAQLPGVFFGRRDPACAGAPPEPEPPPSDLPQVTPKRFSNIENGPYQYKLLHIKTPTGPHPVMSFRGELNDISVSGSIDTRVESFPEDGLTVETTVVLEVINATFSTTDFNAYLQTVSGGPPPGRPSPPPNVYRRENVIYAERTIRSLEDGRILQKETTIEGNFEIFVNAQGVLVCPLNGQHWESSDSYIEDYRYDPYGPIPEGFMYVAFIRDWMGPIGAPRTEPGLFCASTLPSGQPPPLPRKPPMSCCAKTDRLLALLLKEIKELREEETGPLHARYVGSDWGEEGEGIEVPTSLLTTEDDNDDTTEVRTWPQLFLWFVRQFDALAGEWPISLRVSREEGDEPETVKIQNIAEAMAETYGLLATSALDSDVAVAFLMRMAPEIVSLKGMATTTKSIATAIMDWLDFPAKEKMVQMPVNFKPFQDSTNSGKESVDAINKLLEQGSVRIETFHATGKDSFIEDLKKLLYAAAIVKVALGRVPETRRGDGPEPEIPRDLYRDLLTLSNLGKGLKTDRPKDAQGNEIDIDPLTWDEFVLELRNPDHPVNKGWPAPDLIVRGRDTDESGQREG